MSSGYGTSMCTVNNAYMNADNDCLKNRYTMGWVAKFVARLLAELRARIKTSNKNRNGLHKKITLQLADSINSFALVD
jgi:hypothetical protein